MALETGTYISDLVSTNPASSDNISQGDDHIRLLKSTIKATFPNITGAVTATHTELSKLAGVTATTTEINKLAGLTPTTADLNKLTSSGSPQFSTIELGNASDTTLSRTAAGVMAVEGKKVVTEDANGNAAITGVAVMASSFLRNRIINGDMRIDQRNNGAAVTVTGVNFIVDRFFGYASVTSKFTAQQNAGAVTPPAGFKNYLGATSSASTSLGAADFYLLTHRIEGFNIADLNWGTASAQSVTLSFWVRSSLTGTFGGSLSNGSANRSYPFTYSIPSANTWTAISITVTGDTTGTWASNNTNGMSINFGLGVGSTYSGTAGTWAGTAYFSATGATSVVGTNGATLYITGVQLEAGSVATPFERRQYGQELALCQRYYEIVGLVVSTSLAATSALPSAYFSVEKRASPTISTLGYDAGTGANFASSNQTPTKMLYQSSTHSQQAQAKVAASSEL